MPRWASLWLSIWTCLCVDTSANGMTDFESFLTEFIQPGQKSWGFVFGLCLSHVACVPMSLKSNLIQLTLKEVVSSNLPSWAVSEPSHVFFLLSRVPPEVLESVISHTSSLHTWQHFSLDIFCSCWLLRPLPVGNCFSSFENSEPSFPLCLSLDTSFCRPPSFLPFAFSHCFLESLSLRGFCCHPCRVTAWHFTSWTSFSLGICAYLFLVSLDVCFLWQILFAASLQVVSLGRKRFSIFLAKRSLATVHRRIFLLASALFLSWLFFPLILWKVDALRLFLDMHLDILAPMVHVLLRPSSRSFQETWLATEPASNKLASKCLISNTILVAHVPQKVTVWGSGPRLVWVSKGKTGLGLWLIICSGPGRWKPATARQWSRPQNQRCTWRALCAWSQSFV